MVALPASAAEGIPSRARRPERYSHRRADLGSGRRQCLVPPAPDVCLARLLDEPPAGAAVGRPVAPPPPPAGPRLRSQGRMALPGTRLDRDGGRLRLRSAG